MWPSTVSTLSICAKAWRNSTDSSNRSRLALWAHFTSLDRIVTTFHWSRWAPASCTATSIISGGKVERTLFLHLSVSHHRIHLLRRLRPSFMTGNRRTTMSMAAQKIDTWKNNLLHSSHHGHIHVQKTKKHSSTFCLHGSCFTWDMRCE